MGVRVVGRLVGVLTVALFGGSLVVAVLGIGSPEDRLSDGQIGLLRDDPAATDRARRHNSATAGEAQPVSAEQRIGRAALARIVYPWASHLPGWTVVFLPGREGLLGVTRPSERRIEVYVRAEDTVDEVAFTVAHELGHAVDVSLLSEGERRRWREVRQLGESTPWWAETGASDFSTGSGDWAEAFAVSQVSGKSQSQVGGQLTRAQLAVVAELSRS